MMKNPKISGLYAVTPQTADSSALFARVAAALAGGARLVQYRNKSADQQLRREQAAGVQRLCRMHGALLIINDDVTLACAMQADGVHLGRDDLPPAQARVELGPDLLIGVSCYDSLPRAMEAQKLGADYVAFGSFHASAVKPGAVRAPLELLRRARVALDVPVVAIGGIEPDNSRALIEAGADALAVITALFDAPDTAAVARRFVALFPVPDGMTESGRALRSNSASAG
jgi:thiamine-phosphate pyrophosphorylase